MLRQAKWPLDMFQSKRLPSWEIATIFSVFKLSLAAVALGISATSTCLISIHECTDIIHFCSHVHRD